MATSATQTADDDRFNIPMLVPPRCRRSPVRVRGRRYLDATVVPDRVGKRPRRRQRPFVLRTSPDCPWPEYAVLLSRSQTGVSTLQAREGDVRWPMSMDSSFRSRPRILRSTAAL